MKSVVYFLVLAFGTMSFAGEYALNGETMECRINGSNGLPAVVEKGNHNDALVMTEKSNGITVTADYQEGESYIYISYNDTVNKNQLSYTVPFVDLGLPNVIKTAGTDFTLSGVKTKLTCNVRAVSTGVPIPPSPKIN
jgi:hypothetical protein